MDPTRVGALRGCLRLLLLRPLLRPLLPLLRLLLLLLRLELSLLRRLLRLLCLLRLLLLLLRLLHGGVNPFDAVCLLDHSHRLDCSLLYLLHYLLRGLAKLPSHVGVVQRGIPDLTVAAQYTLHRPIKWRAFTSSTTLEEAAAGFFEEGADGVIFRITVSSGKRITPLSFFPEEGEVLLWPGQRYTVTRAAYIENGRTYIELTEVTELVF